MNRKALSLVLAGVLSASMVIPAFATGGGAYPAADGTDVWAGIVIEDLEARIKVEVPTLFAFVVNGSVTSPSGVGVVDGDILLPNMKVKVDTPSTVDGSGNAIGAEYSIQTVGEGTMQFTNYSTKKANTTSGSTGLEVTINGNIENVSASVSNNYWEHVASTAVTKDTTAFKKYNVNITSGTGTGKVTRAFDTPAAGGLEMVTGIALAAPIDIESGVNLDWDAGTGAGTKLAIAGNTETVTFGVTVGGERGQYNQVEQSAKVGAIVWTISAPIDNPNVTTAPDAPYLD